MFFSNSGCRLQSITELPLQNYHLSYHNTHARYEAIKSLNDNYLPPCFLNAQKLNGRICFLEF